MRRTSICASLLWISACLSPGGARAHAQSSPAPHAAADMAAPVVNPVAATAAAAMAALVMIVCLGFTGKDASAATATTRETRESATRGLKAAAQAME